VVELSAFTLIGIGILFISLEIFFLSFYIMWIGLGFVLVGIISFFYKFSDGYIQISLSVIVGVILLLIFKNKFKRWVFKKTPKMKDEFLEEEGIGEVREEKIYYKGTYWDYIGNGTPLKNGQKVKIKKVEGNKVYI